VLFDGFTLGWIGLVEAIPFHVVSRNVKVLGGHLRYLAFHNGSRSCSRTPDLRNSNFSNALIARPR
jgi:hypothetical protein